MIPGLKLIPDAITHHQEQDLLSHIEQELYMVDGKRYNPGREWVGRNKIFRYGWGYDRDEWLGDIPAWVPKELASSNGLYGFDSVTINHYLPGNGLLPHIDSLRFGSPILVLSLGGDGELIFYHSESPVAACQQSCEVHTPRLSLLVMDEESRYKWTHEVLPSVAERFSIVFRKRISQ